MTPLERREIIICMISAYATWLRVEKKKLADQTTMQNWIDNGKLFRNQYFAGL